MQLLLYCFCFVGVKRLEMFGIPVPRYALVNREVPCQELDYFVEEDDFVEVHGMRFWKPFVEKPVDGEIFILLSSESISVGICHICLFIYLLHRKGLL